ncbi:hypothetical protein ACBR55_00065 [Salinicoccus roseus]|uniref:hypothetical protein n=1 Tax=Salinicoccus roseus TaxID=45670 RepID=UPI003523D61D
MDDKVISHRRFLDKMERDMEADRQNDDHAAFVDKFRRYEALLEPDIGLIEQFYRALSSIGKHDEIIDYALLQMNAGRGHYDVHMRHLLEGLLSQERYFEVVEFSDHLMKEEIPHDFRIEVAALRHRAKKAIDEKKEAPMSETPEVDADSYNDMQSYERMDFLKQIIEEADDRYRELIRNAAAGEDNPELLTFMLLYLRTAGDGNVIAVHKMGERIEVVPGELHDLEEGPFRSISARVIDEVEDRIPQFAESAAAMLMSHMLYCYPIEPPFGTEDMVAAYLEEILGMVNIEYEVAANPQAVSWIRALEQSIAGE